jgi:hypothetical protein
MGLPYQIEFAMSNGVKGRSNIYNHVDAGRRMKEICKDPKTVSAVLWTTYDDNGDETSSPTVIKRRSETDLASFEITPM